MTRFFLAAATLITTVVAAAVFVDIVLADGAGVLDAGLIVLFTILFAWVAQGFWTAAIGAWVLARRPKGIAAPSADPSQKPTEYTDGGADGSLRTAIVMPVYNEDPTRVMAGLRAIYDSLQATGSGDQFDLFILSDTTDPENWLEEEAAWATLCLDAATGAAGIFYRRRPFNVGRKSGNLLDFCQRWGRRYEFMIVLDADSLMSGSTLVEMVRRMRADPKLGILQAPPQPIDHHSLFARIQQFAAAMYGPMFTAGFARWTADAGNYYGHNAIIRTAAFMAHCGLPHLPGEAPLGGEILSHDFVEAAMIRRGGWTVRIDPDLDGSYEELPTTLLDYAKRDRRWCQGNLQHGRIALAKGMPAISRLHLIMGVMAYVASPLWLVFLALAAVAQLDAPGGEVAGWLGSADLLRWQSAVLFGVVMLMLVLPKGWAWLLLFREPARLERFGGAWRSLMSVVVETLFSVLLAPIMMAFHSRFVFEILSGRTVAWATQQRGEHGTTLSEAMANHRGQVVGGALASVLAWLLVPGLFVWLLPVTLGLMLSPVISSLTSRGSVGRQARTAGLFLIPAEIDPPDVLYRMHQWLADAELAEDPEHSAPTSDRFTQAVLDPTFNTLHVSLLRAYGVHTRETPQVIAARKKAIEHGPASLTKAEKLAILSHEETIRWLHGVAWQRWKVEG